MEIWKPVKGFTDYEISNTGRIRRISTGKITTGTMDLMGYPKISFYVDGKSYTDTIHRVVAKVFIPNEENKPQVHHINGIKTDNRVENLMWCTPKEHGELFINTPEMTNRRKKPKWNKDKYKTLEEYKQKVEEYRKYSF